MDRSYNHLEGKDHPFNRTPPRPSFFADLELYKSEYLKFVKDHQDEREVGRHQIKPGVHFQEVSKHMNENFGLNDMEDATLIAMLISERKLYQITKYYVRTNMR